MTVYLYDMSLCIASLKSNIQKEQKKKKKSRNYMNSNKQLDNNYDDNR